MDREAIIEALERHFSHDDSVAAVYLFGSVATGRFGRRSDVDVGVLYRDAPPRTLLGQPFEDQERLGALVERPLQLVVMNHAPVDLVHRILRDGLLVVEKDRERRVAFEVRSRAAYHDLLPVLREYRIGARS